MNEEKTTEKGNQYIKNSFFFCLMNTLRLFWAIMYWVPLLDHFCAYTSTAVICMYMFENRTLIKFGRNSTENDENKKKIERREFSVKNKTDTYEHILLCPCVFK